VSRGGRLRLREPSARFFPRDEVKWWLCALVPPPGAQTVRYHRVLAGHHAAYASFVAVDQSRVVGDCQPDRIEQPVDAAEAVDMSMGGLCPLPCGWWRAGRRAAVRGAAGAPPSANSGCHCPSMIVMSLLPMLITTKSMRLSPLKSAPARSNSPPPMSCSTGGAKVAGPSPMATPNPDC